MDAPEPELPPPSSGLFLEVSFRRLLAKCESVVRGDANASATTSTPSPSSIRPELARDWATSPVFHHYVETLLEQLADLEGAAPAKRPSPEVLEAYKRRADLLSTMLRPPAAPPSYVLALAGASGGKGAGRGGSGDPSTSGAAAVAAPAPAPENDDVDDEARRAELLGPATSTSPPSVPPALRPAAPPASLRGLAPATRDEIETQRGLQETLTDDLVGLARQLRANAEAAGAAVAEREKLLKVAETQLDGAVEGAKRSVAEVKAVYFANRRGFWATLLTFLMVGAVFTATFVYIRATSLLGFSSRKAAAASARRVAARAQAKAAKGAAASKHAAASGGGVGAEQEVAAAAASTEATTETIATAAEGVGVGDDAFFDASASLDDAGTAAVPDHTEL